MEKNLPRNYLPNFFGRNSCFPGFLGHFFRVSGHFFRILGYLWIGIYGLSPKSQDLARFGRFGQIWPDSARLARFGRFGYLADLADLARFGQIWPDSARFGQIRPDSARFGQIRPDSARFGQNGQIPGIRTILARGGPSSGILDPQIPDSGPPNWHKSGGGGISCIRSSGTLSPGTYRSQILARSGTRALGTRILGTFWEFSAEMDHFSGTPPEPDSGPPLAGFWTPPGRILGPPPGQIRPDSARFGQIRPDSARFGQIRPDSARFGQIRPKVRGPRKLVRPLIQPTYLPSTVLSLTPVPISSVTCESLRCFLLTL